MPRGVLDGGLVQADIAHWAYYGLGMFEADGAQTSLRAVANLYPESLHLVAGVKSEIKTVADLRGKRVSLDEAGSGTLHDAMLILGYYGYRDKRFPANTYKNNGDTSTLAVGAQLLVSESLSEQTVYELTRALWHKQTLAQLRDGHPKGGEIDPTRALRGISVPLHPGAERYYREAGLLGDREKKS
jgi:TRAP-type uncharacterized transport system substrate-binding protein